MTDLNNLEVENTPVTMAECRTIIGNISHQYPHITPNMIREVSFACINYIAMVRLEFGHDDLACDQMLNQQIMPRFKIVEDGKVNLIFKEIKDEQKTSIT